MLIPNTTIWETRIQNVEALLTASTPTGGEVYYLATVCQVGLDPALISVSPNPEYPICSAIEESGLFGLSFLSDQQGSLVERCVELDRSDPDKLRSLTVPYETSSNGTPLLVECIQSIECRLERHWDSGDHRTYVGTVLERRIPREFRASRPRRFGGGQAGGRRLLKWIAGQTRLYDLVVRMRGRGAQGIAEGTARHIGLGAGPQRSGAGTKPGHASGTRPSSPGVCLVGCGWWGSVHALGLKQLGPSVRRFFASRSLQDARSFAQRFDGEDAFEGLERALEDSRVDAVILALPHDMHFSAALAALDAGKHVLVEKPLALDVSEGKQLLRRATEKGLCLAVAEQYRLSPLVKKAHQLIHEGRIGRVRFAHAGALGRFRPAQPWKMDRKRMGGGILLDVGLHYVNVLRLWLGEPEWAWATTPTRPDGRLGELGGEDSALVVLGFPGEIAAELHLSWSTSGLPAAPNFEIVGERATLRLWFDKPYLVLTEPLSETHWMPTLRRHLPWRIERRVGPWLKQYREERVRVHGYDLIGSNALIQDFISAIRGEQPSETPGTEGLRDLQVIQAAYEAAASGVRVRVAPRSGPGELD